MFLKAEVLLQEYKTEHGFYLIPEEVIRQLKVSKFNEGKRICLKCGDEFIVRHGNQKFCPPKPGRKRSNCENAYNQALKRKRRKKEEEKENGKETRSA